MSFTKRKNFRRSTKQELKKNLFLENIFSDPGRSEQFKSGLRSAHTYRFQHDRYFSFQESSFDCFWRQNHASGKPSRSRVCSQTEKEEEKNLQKVENKIKKLNSEPKNKEKINKN